VCDKSGLKETDKSIPGVFVISTSLIPLLLILETNIVRAATSRRIGYFTSASFLIFLLIVSLLAPVNFTYSSQTVGGEQFHRPLLYLQAQIQLPHSLELKAVQDEDNAEPRRVSGFKLDMTNVVTAQINSQLLVFITDSSMQITDAKVRTVSDQLIDLVFKTRSI
jgi:hypothetical protein